MKLEHGQRLGAYEIRAVLGVGGMGVVYRATDTRLNRDVAIKTSTEVFVRRFQTEARLIASLNHPNICTLHDVGPDYLVMELIEGPTLAERIAEKPISVEEALAIAGQIQQALAAAHAHGIVHRDLKPGNIKVKPDGTVKVLDFGLATEGGAVAASVDSLTITLAATRAGVILGTPAYMAPEQTRGNAVDKRADIWAFGVVLYEMVTGRRLFAGDSFADIVASVIEREPDLDAVPTRLRRLLGACLQKDPRHRLQDISDAMLLLEPGVPIVPAAVPAPHRRASLWIATAVAAVVMTPLSVVSIRHFTETPPVARQVRFTLTTPPLASGTQFYLALAPDNSSLAFTASTADGVPRIFVRDMASLDSRLLPGTEGAVSLFWSPDSRYLGFGQQNMLKKIDVAASSAPTTIAELNATVGMGAWNAEGVIAFGLRAPGQRLAMHRVAASGGTATDLTLLAGGEVIHSCPVFLPDGQSFLYIRTSDDAERRGLYVGSIVATPADQPNTRVLDTPRGALLVPDIDGRRSVRALFNRDGALITQSFDIAQLKPIGDPVVVVDYVRATGLCGSFAATRDVLAYRGAADGGVRLTWYDRNGTVLGSVPTQQTPIAISLSPDDTRLALSDSGGDLDIWIVDLPRAASTRLTFSPTPDLNPVWSPNGDTIAYSDYSNNMYRKSSDGSGESKLLLTNAIPLDWSADGRYLLYATNRGTDTDVWVLPLDGSGRNAAPVAATPFPEGQARFSRDGQWIAYVSTESGQRPEVYVRRFVAPGEGSAVSGKLMVSNGGGSQPRWSPDGKEVYYLSRDGRLTSVAIRSAGDSVYAATPVPLFSAPIVGGMPAIEGVGVVSGMPRWDISHDGSRFLFSTTNADSNSAPITILENWQSMVKK